MVVRTQKKWLNELQNEINKNIEVAENSKHSAHFSENKAYYNGCLEILRRIRDEINVRKKEIM